MYGYRFVIEEFGYQIPVHTLRHERNVRGGYFAQRNEYGIKRGIRRRLVLGHSAAPVSLSAATNVPVGKFVREVLNISRRLESLVFGKSFIDYLYKSVEFGQYPLVHKREFAFFNIVFRRVVFVDVRVQHEKRVSVPERSHKFTLTFGNRLFVESRRKPRRAARVEVPSDSVRALFVENRPRVYNVA